MTQTELAEKAKKEFVLDKQPGQSTISDLQSRRTQKVVIPELDEALATVLSKKIRDIILCRREGRRRRRYQMELSKSAGVFNPYLLFDPPGNETYADWSAVVHSVGRILCGMASRPHGTTHTLEPHDSPR
ncbi:hypothetical protein DVH05_002501 [Phytophthora capsici]|nr:hypothetical protein DVH05_002501 [Phytophthora capsici]